MSDFFKKDLSLKISAIVMAILVFLLGYFVGTKNVPEVSRINSLSNTSSSVKVDFEPFWKTWNIINEKYMPTVSTTTVSDQQKVYGAIEGLVSSLGDPHSVFFPPVEAKEFAEAVSGSFEGVGMEVDIREGVLTVVSPIKGTPAYRAGIKSGDKILSIDGKPTQNLKTEDAVRLIKGKKGTEVKFDIIRDGVKDPLKISVIRDVISIPTIDTEVKSDVFIIHLYSFSATSPNLFRGALREFIESGRNKMIIDLRGNPGGYLEAAVDMASWFLPSGKTIVIEEARDADNSETFRSRGYDIFNDKLKLAILIDGGSASASEILAGALSEHKKAVLVGTKSFGKGSVQELVPVTDDTSVKITIARWLTPNGFSISNGGLTPDIEVKFDPEKFLKGEDVQLNRAIEELNK